MQTPLWRQKRIRLEVDWNNRKFGFKEQVDAVAAREQHITRRVASKSLRGEHILSDKTRQSDGILWEYYNFTDSYIVTQMDPAKYDP
ncbi:hypothetical protein J6590_007835 [Homalodisca vitripennis]|nr:hypothetical protein J6590_007835 [Homalodisca vitripennis]